MNQQSEIGIPELLASLARASQGEWSEQEYFCLLEHLESYECWDPWFKAVKEHAAKHPHSFVDDHCRMARVHVRYFDNIQAAAECCKVVVESSGMSFSQFRTDVLDRVLEPEDFSAEGVVIQQVWERFSNLDDRAFALERLCFLYEKKVHNEKLLHQFYERLLKLQSGNVKALRYFKTLYSQLQDWPAVNTTLKKLLATSKHPQEGFRFAQELAAVYLYQQDNPKEAIQVIEQYCSNSTLDTSTIHYEAYYRLGDHGGCLKVLRGCLASIEDDSTRAIIHYRIGSLYEKSGDMKLAYENYERTLTLEENFLEAIEGLISTSIKQKNWNSVKDWLSVLASRVSSPGLANQVRAGLSRLEEGLKIAPVS